MFLYENQSAFLLHNREHSSISFFNIICIRLCMNEFFLRISANDEPGSDNDAGYRSPPYSAHYLGRMLIGGTTTPHIIPKPQVKLY